MAEPPVVDSTLLATEIEDVGKPPTDASMVNGVLTMGVVDDSIPVDKVSIIVSVIFVVIVLVVVIGEELLVKTPPADEVSKMRH